MTDWGASNRVDRYEFLLCDPFTLRETASIEADAASSSLSWDLGADALYSGTITLLEDAGRDRLLRVRRTVEADGEAVTENIATMFVCDTEKAARFGQERTEASCYSTLYRLTEDRLPSDFSRAKDDEPVVEAIMALIEEVGGKLAVADGVDKARKFGRNIWFEMGESRYVAASTMASWIGCRLGCDGEGQITLTPIADPAQAPERYVFEAGRNCTYLPGLSEASGRIGTANRVVAYYTDGEATDRVEVELGDECAFSYARCGRYQTDIIKVDPCSRAELERRAKEHLQENSGEVRSYIIEHVAVPGLSVGDIVRYENDTDLGKPLSVRCQVEQMDAGSLAHGTICTTKLKRIE